MELTDAQVLAQLRIRRIKLKMELDKVEIAIKAFERVDVESMNMLELLPYATDEIDVDEDFMQSVLIYNPKDSVEKKIVFILGKIGSGTAEDICEYLLRIDGHIKDGKRVFNRVTYVASRMFRLGQITADRAGRRNIYKLIDRQ